MMLGWVDSLSRSHNFNALMPSMLFTAPCMLVCMSCPDSVLPAHSFFELCLFTVVNIVVVPRTGVVVTAVVGRVGSVGASAASCC